MAHQVVHSAAEHALLFRERVQLATLGIVLVGGVHLRQGAFTQTFAVCQGVLGEAGKEGGVSVRARPSHTQTHTCSLSATNNYNEINKHVKPYPPPPRVTNTTHFQPCVLLLSAHISSHDDLKFTAAAELPDPFLLQRYVIHARI